MSNNYVESSFAIGNLTPKEVSWWVKEARRYNTDNPDRIYVDPEDLDPPYSSDWELNELESDSPMIWFYHDECIDVELAAMVIQRFLKECRPTKSVGFTWAETCSKTILNAFGGGACFVTADNIEWNSAYTWLQDKEKHTRKS